VDLDGLLATSTGNGDGAGPLPGAGACETAQRSEISLPRDDAPHNTAASIEWWWWNGHLTAADGHRLAFEVWFASRPVERFYWVDYTVTDVSDGTFHYGRQPMIPGQPAETTRGFSLHGEHALADGGDGTDHIRFEVDGYTLDLDLAATKPTVKELDNGYGDFFCQSTYFYRRPRMEITGRLSRGGSTQSIAGTANFLHQWGFMPAIDAVQSTYITAELNDGRDVFLGIVTLRALGNVLDYRMGSISASDGTVTILHRDDYSIMPTSVWQRDATCSYPSGYDVDVAGVRLHVRAALPNSEVRATRWPEMYGLWPAWPDYWDGATVVTGDANGVGWLDLGGYCL
jgi:predicted secreted hydrolase